MKQKTTLVRAVWLLAAVGCQNGVAPTELLESQTPPAVQAAWLRYHPGMTIQKVTSTPMNGQPTYRFQYKDNGGADHVTIYNIGGDEIESTN